MALLAIKFNVKNHESPQIDNNNPDQWLTHFSFYAVMYNTPIMVCDGVTLMLFAYRF